MEAIAASPRPDKRRAELNPYVLVGIGGVLGANARYLVSTRAADRFGVDFPYGTLLINASGSFLMGAVLTLLAGRFHSNRDATLLITTGFLGAYTTFSTFAYETVILMRQGGIKPMMVNAFASAIAGISGAALGILAIRVVVG